MKKADSEGLAPSARFEEFLLLIEGARQRAYRAINTELVGLYWALGQYLSQKIDSAEWGDGVVLELARAIALKYPGVNRFCLGTGKGCAAPATNCCREWCAIDSYVANPEKCGQYFG